ncbi:MAG: bifunctional phosphoribosyl-AMP cyclohydrolase/phosphoribosyl-ATP diphosphatase HisIE [Actinomycetota bacterium]|nr:bifunctional phosphoribosyl-AMP cyclohydrolase/phosphoribosyl-ATP diphosphatase HisIE [Actinomycetota bacterium]
MANKTKLIPAIVQDYKTKQVLMLAYVSQESLEKSLQTGTTWFWSRSRNRLWNKGETSGNYQTIKEIRYDCDQDALLFLVEQKGQACHTGNFSCFYRRLEDGGAGLKFKPDTEPDIVKELHQVILDRIAEKPADSYTYSLHQKGLDQILKKVGEECIEVILAAKHQQKTDVVYEIADLAYHLLVLMAEKGIQVEDIYQQLEQRRR